MGRTRTEWHHNCTDFRSGPEAFPRGENISAARAFPFAFFQTACDQGDLAHQSKRGLAAGCGRKMEITQLPGPTTVRSFCETGC